MSQSNGDDISKIDDIIYVLEAVLGEESVKIASMIDYDLARACATKTANEMNIHIRVITYRTVQCEDFYPETKHV
jgi:hypothetical protein